MIKGFSDYDEIRRLVSQCQARGYLWKSDSTPASSAQKYRPKRTPAEELKHQKDMLKEAKADLAKSKEGGRKWKNTKIRISVVKRLLDLAKSKSP